MINSTMNDKQIIEGLITRDNRLTHQFFFVKCRPLLSAILISVFDNKLHYEEMVNELYLYLMDNDCYRLRQFDFKSTIYQWLKVVALRFFIQKRSGLIENYSQDHLYKKVADRDVSDTAQTVGDCMDVSRLLELMKNRRHAMAIRYLILEDMRPAQCAALMKVKVENLYNIKKRAMDEITEIAIKYYNYGK